MPTFRSLLLLTVLLSALLPCRGQQMPQDNWIYEGKRALGTFRCLHIAKDNLIYVGSTNVIAVFDSDLNFVRQFGTVGTVKGIASDSATNIYVLETSTIKAYNPITGALLTQWGSAGTNDGQFSNPDGPSGGSMTPTVACLAIDANNEVYIGDHGNGRIQVFSTNGSFLRKWGPQVVGQVALNAAVPYTISVTPEGYLAVTHAVPFDIGTRCLQVFKPDGTFVLRINLVSSSISSSGSGRQIVTTMDNMLVVASQANYPIVSVSSMPIYSFSSLGVTRSLVDPLGNSLIRTQIGHSGTYLRIDGLAYSDAGDCYMLPYSHESTSFGSALGLCAFKRVYPNGHKTPIASVPQPRLQTAVQRQVASFVDFDYFVRDGDSSTVQVAVLGFTNGVNTLSGLIRMTNFVEGTITNLGAGIPANTTRRVTWDPTTDWNFGFGNIQFEVLAKDERGLFPFHFLNVPASGTNAAVKVSDKAPTDADFLSLWFWLVATSDSEVRFTSGEVFGTVAPNVDVKFATGTTTTAAGRTYLLNRLGVRAITAAEVTQANSGRYGFPATVTTSHVVKLP